MRSDLGKAGGFLKRLGTGFHRHGQTIIELVFAMVVILFMIYGLVRAARWVVLDTADRRVQHDLLLRSSASVEQQLNPQGYRVRNPDLEYRVNEDSNSSVSTAP